MRRLLALVLLPNGAGSALVLASVASAVGGMLPVGCVPVPVLILLVLL